MSDELKPCPFCGEDAAKLTSLQGQFVVVCHGCGARGSMCQKEEGAARWWNTRAERTCKYESTNRCTWVCTSCGMEIETRHFGYKYCPNCGAKVVE